MGSWWRRDRDAEIRQEFESHLDLEADRLKENGIPDDDARDLALKRFGNTISYREDTRAAHGLVWWDHLSHDLRHAGRAIRGKPIAATAAMLALGVGIGGPAAVLSVILSTSMLVPPGVLRPDELVMIWETPPRQPGSRRDPSPETYRVWQANALMFQQISAGAGSPMVLSLTTGDTPERVSVQMLDVGLLDLMGLSPLQGRQFGARDAEPGADPVAIVSQAFWETRLGSRDDIIGSTIDLHGRSTTVVGVMPRTFWFGNRNVEIWVPMPSRDDAASGPVLVIARMRDGDHKRAVHERLGVLAAQVSAAQPSREAGWSTRVDGLGASEMLNSEDMAPGFKVLLIAAVLGLLAACANIATVMVARGAARQLDTAVRAALGAPRARLVRQFLIESVVVAFGGGALALAVVVAALRLIAAFAPADLAMAINPTPGIGLIAGIAIAALAIGLLAGLGPAMTDSRVDLTAALKSTGYFGSVRGSSRLRRALVITEVTITVMLLAGVAILARGAIALSGTGPGFDASRVISMRIDPVRHIGRATAPALDVETVKSRFAAVSGVESVAEADGPMGRRTSVTISAAGDFAAREERRAQINYVSEEYFETIGLRLVEGRAFDAGDRHGAPVVVVADVFARQQFPGSSAVGRALRIGNDQTERTIVGVVSNVLLDGIRRQPSPIVYAPVSARTAAAADNNGNTGIGLLVRFTPGARVLRDMQRALAAIDPLQTVTYAAIIQDALSVGAMEVRFTVYLAGPVILLALALTMSGIYGVLAQTVAQRTHEVALRLALGAERRDVLRLIVLQGLKLTAIGAVAGAAAALAVDRLVGSFVLGVPGERPVALIAATLTIVAATIAASVVPCLRAMRIDPATVLRYE